MRKTKLCIGFFLLMVLVVSLSGGIAFGTNPTDSSPNKMITSSSYSFDSFLKYYQFDQENACWVTQATDRDCLATGSKYENKTLLAALDPTEIRECMQGCTGFRFPENLVCFLGCTPAPNPPAGE